MTNTTDTDSSEICVAALYHFTPFADHKALQAPLLAVCNAGGVMGTLLLAHEGINGTIAGQKKSIDAVLTHIRALPGCESLGVKFSSANDMPFLRMKVRLKREIVTMGVPETDPLSTVGTYVAPQDWNALISDPDTIVIDTRNDYEVLVGQFSGAIDPETATFRDFPAWFRDNRERLLGEGHNSAHADGEAGKPKKVAMYCTGGIRCEKSTAFLKNEGIDEVFHLKGGILQYLEDIPEEESLWEGECFVFDQRVTVGHGLKIGDYAQCHACRRPIDKEGLASPFYELGVSCEACHHERTDDQRARYRERQKQELLARKGGRDHLGADIGAAQAEAAEAKAEQAEKDRKFEADKRAKRGG